MKIPILTIFALLATEGRASAIPQSFLQIHRSPTICLSSSPFLNQTHSYRLHRRAPTLSDAIAPLLLNGLNPFLSISEYAIVVHAIRPVSVTLDHRTLHIPSVVVVKVADRRSDRFKKTLNPLHKEYEYSRLQNKSRFHFFTLF